jgi:hypothetical protein
MKLSYTNQHGQTCTTSAKISVNEPGSTNPLPVLVLDDGSQVDVLSWILLNYKVVQASDKDIKQLRSWLRAFPVAGRM